MRFDQGQFLGRRVQQIDPDGVRWQILQAAGANEADGLAKDQQHDNLRSHGFPLVTFKAYGAGGGDSNPHGVTPNGFSYQLRLSPPPEGVCGLDYPFTVAAAKALRV